MLPISIKRVKKANLSIKESIWRRTQIHTEKSADVLLNVKNYGGNINYFEEKLNSNT
jgi:hypothetical protein